MAGSGVIRRLWPIEGDRVRDHLLRLDPESRRLRFGGLTGPAQIEAHCGGLDWRRGAIVGYLEAGAVRGLGELLPATEGGTPAAELAVSVEPRWQNRGIGTALLRRLIVAARNRLIGRLYMVCLIDNHRMVRMARRFDGRLDVRPGRSARPDRAALADLVDGAGGELGGRAGDPAAWHGCNAAEKKAALRLTVARGAPHPSREETPQVTKSVVAGVS